MKTILVLGSEGLIGKSLCDELNLCGYETVHFDKKINFDILKHLNELEKYIKESNFVFFLAFDVGGSEYLLKHEHTFDFISNNVNMMNNVFSLCKKYNKRFIFASTMMTKMPQSTYGILKSLGERYTNSLNGISVRFWNVYGPEKIEKNKNHVITDFIVSALKNKKINCKTDGTEVRQFLHTKDASISLIKIMESFEKTLETVSCDNNCIDISTGVWTEIKDIAKYIGHKTNSIVSFQDNKDKVQKNMSVEPNLHASEVLNLESNKEIYKSIDELIEHYKQELCLKN